MTTTPASDGGAIACPLCGTPIHRSRSPRCPRCHMDTASPAYAQLVDADAMLQECHNSYQQLVTRFNDLNDRWRQWQAHREVLIAHLRATRAAPPAAASSLRHTRRSRRRCHGGNGVGDSTDVGSRAEWPGMDRGAWRARTSHGGAPHAARAHRTGTSGCLRGVATYRCGHCVRGHDVGDLQPRASRGRDAGGCWCRCLPVAVAQKAHARDFERRRRPGRDGLCWRRCVGARTRGARTRILCRASGAAGHVHCRVDLGPIGRQLGGVDGRIGARRRCSGLHGGCAAVRVG